MEKIAIIYTTFLRNKLMYQTAQSIINNWQDNYILFILDQNGTTEKQNYFTTIMSKEKKDIRYYIFSFDCGLSYARNFGIKKASEMGIPYCLITADSIEFTDKYNFEPIKNLLECSSMNILVGLKLKRRCRWEFELDLIEGEHFLLSPNTFPVIDYQGFQFQRTEICKNFYLAKTKLLNLIKWDENLKLCEHEDFFWRVKQSNYHCYFTNSIEANYVRQFEGNYGTYRQRLYKEFQDKLRAKYNIKTWIKYAPGLNFD